MFQGKLISGIVKFGNSKVFSLNLYAVRRTITAYAVYVDYTVVHIVDYE
jgi:hypothetical protein